MEGKRFIMGVLFTKRARQMVTEHEIKLTVTGYEVAVLCHALALLKAAEAEHVTPRARETAAKMYEQLVKV